MQIISRMCMTADGYVTTPDGIPPQVVDPVHGPGSHGISDFIVGCEAVLMGRTTFEPALAADPWPWPDLEVFVLGSHRTPGAPDDVVFDDDPVRLLEKLRAANKGRDVHLVGGPRTIETFRALGVVDKLELVVLPFMVGAGMRLSESLDPRTGLSFESSRPLPGGSVEIVYSVAAV
ncbi:dihydrofolate reductase family protein [Labedaea rhizosphaerae]|uniref:Dihydrofolate reductase n=1 Tax=Labedaea rhizosphaerae TaxID=598644 RepID=A0A4R6SDP4_LABRH|nr:dihydrofolate reductase family protein [Labedaea rhizosphaerae]TDP98002.1 dihydrofolate reductase [Labedaea rhizosphaerae]